MWGCLTSQPGFVIPPGRVLAGATPLRARHLVPELVPDEPGQGTITWDRELRENRRNQNVRLRRGTKRYAFPKFHSFPALSERRVIRLLLGACRAKRNSLRSRADLGVVRLGRVLRKGA
jgi:hypothetical protein